LSGDELGVIEREVGGLYARVRDRISRGAR
jgi:hypothetical protein